MTLREVCGLTTEEIARAFLAAPPTVAQRIARAQGQDPRRRIPYEVPSPAERPDRLEPVLRVVYLIFTEGCAPAAGDAVVRADLADEAIRLGRLLVDLPPEPEPEALGLLALLLLQHSRRAARATAAAHAEAPSAEATGWDRMVRLYDLLARGQLDTYPLAHAARADLLRVAEARASYQRALDLSRQEPQRRFLRRRLLELGQAADGAGQPAGSGAACPASKPATRRPGAVWRQASVSSSRTSAGSAVASRMLTQP
jgi:RNA polymerase sigma-70 factor (ECF subfamily)